MNKNRILLRYIFNDILAAFVVWLAFVLFRKIINDIHIFDGIRLLIPNSGYLYSFMMFPFYCVFIHYLTGFYVNIEKKTRLSLVVSSFVSALMISISVFFVLKLSDVTVSYRYFYYSLLVLFALQFFITLIFRNSIYAKIRNNFKSKKWTINTLIVGTGANARKIAEDIEKYAEKNTLIGFVAVNKKIGVPQERVLGNNTQIDSIIERYQIQETIVALDNDADEMQLFKIINSLYKFNIDIRFTPRLYEILTGSAKIENLDMSPLVSITDSSMSDWEASLKRFFDVVFSFFALFVLSPFLLYFMISIRRDSKGPVFYKQERIGRHGKPFNILKFRTMYTGSENGVPRLSSANDSRITPVGRMLRKYRIDEVPQFWNILKGDMSVVGPRPERRYYINQIIEEAPYYCLLYKIRPGLTSWGPIKIGYSDSVKKMIERLNYDIIYLDNMSLLTDFKILIYTLEIIFKGKGV